jgi:dolichol kinase
MVALPKLGLISFGLGLVAFIYFFIGPKQLSAQDVPLLWYIISWFAWAASLIGVLIGVESLRQEKGKSLIWPIAGLILGGLALLMLLTWLSCAEIAAPPPPVAIP